MMTLERLHNHSKGLRDVHWGACVYLLDGPKTMEQLRTACGSAPFPMAQSYGFYAAGQWNQRSLEKLPADLTGLLAAGWVKQNGDLFALTDYGRKQVNQTLGQASASMEWVLHKLQALLRPDMASKITLAVQVILALIKIPAGVLSGSVGLLNDAADTLLDLVSGALVYLGIRFNRERLVSILLVAFMLGTGSFTFFEAVRRIFTPYVPKVDWFPFAAALLSALAGLLLWTYQRYIGIHSGSMAFIAESVDARNHVIVSLGVTAGLLAALLHFGWLDMAVGLVVALLILWSAVQLVIDLVKSSGQEKVDLSHYGFWLLNIYDHLRDMHLKEWMLNLVDRGEALTKKDLLERARQAFDFRNNPWMKFVGLDRQFANEAEIEHNLNEAFTRGWFVDQEPLRISPAGKEYLLKQSQRRRRHVSAEGIERFKKRDK